MSWILKLIGGRVGLVLIAALVGTGIWGWSQARAADAERTRADELVAHKAILAERLGQVADEANRNAAAAARARQEARERESAVASLQQRLTAAREQTEAEVVQLREVTIDAPDAYRSCTDVRAPRDIGRMLRVPDASSGGRDASRDGVRDAARADAGAVPDSAAGLGDADPGRDRRAGASAGQGAGGLQRAAEIHPAARRIGALRSLTDPDHSRPAPTLC